MREGLPSAWHTAEMLCCYRASRPQSRRAESLAPTQRFPGPAANSLRLGLSSLMPPALPSHLKSPEGPLCNLPCFLEA